MFVNAVHDHQPFEARRVSIFKLIGILFVLLI